MALVIPHHGWTPHTRLLQPFHGAGRVEGQEPAPEPTPEPYVASGYYIDGYSQ